MIRTHILGFPRVGAQRELKFALERHWRGEIDATALKEVARDLRRRHWQLQREAQLDLVTVGDFSLYDHVLDHIQMFGCEPARFGFTEREAELSRCFAMARGVVEKEEACSCCGSGHDDGGRQALEMTKWFDTNYHYLVPEFDERTTFRLAAHRLVSEVAEAQALGHVVKPVLIGPVTFLWLGKSRVPGFDRLALLDALLPCYVELLALLKARGVEWVQIDEPILGLDLPMPWRRAFERAYHSLQGHSLQGARVRLMLATYFSSLEENIATVCKLPIDALHVDTVRTPHELRVILDWMPVDMELSVGVVDGRNIWRTDLDVALERLRFARDRHGGQLWIAPSCSLLHVPLSLSGDTGIDPDVRGWLAGAVEKLDELALLKRAWNYNEGNHNERNHGETAVADELEAARAAIASRRASARITDPAVAQRLAALPADVDQRGRPFFERQPLQRERFQLPPLPTTTIGSFPQTPAIRAARAAFRRGALDEADYRQAMRHEIEYGVRLQESLGIDVLVHGEAERNDMVEYFGEQLAGFTFSSNGWVQSYGSRCVKPPILYGDVSRPRPMTVAWSRYAQSLTSRPMKGMLTGPVTILQWSFVRDDQPRQRTALQIALAIRDEVVDLEQAGIGIIQIDEPAFREGLPLRQSQWREYLAWAAHTFRVAASGVGDSTQIHTHMCYSEFNDILSEIAAMDADVITIETSRSDMELLRGFGAFNYPNEIGPGVYDIHSPRIPSVEEIERMLRKAAEVIPFDKLWVNPDCGLKTRGWPETEAALRNMVDATRRLRSEADRQ